MQSNKWWFRKFTNMLISCLVLFIAAGTVKWPMAWLYVAFLIGSIFVNHQVLHPELRIVQSMRIDGTKKWDLVTAPFVTTIGPLVMLLTAGLDKRYDWSAIPALVQFIAFILLLFGASIGLWAKKANRFYYETVRIQYESHHGVITEGPYRFVRHPGYTGQIIVSLVTPLVLGSLTTLMPSTLIVLAYLARTILEDITLQRQFKGYYNYTKKVPYRLIPGIF